MTYSATDIAASFAHLTVLIIGDVMLDTYTVGRADRISPEAPVPVVHIASQESRLGGAGNVALNLAALGATPLLVAAIGDDTHGVQLRQLMDNRNLSNEGLIVCPSRPTTVKERILSGSHQMIRLDYETDKLLNTQDASNLENKALALLSGCDLVLFQDYDKGVISKDLIDEVITAAKKQDIPVVVDPKKRNFMSYAGATLFKPNLKELSEGLQAEIEAAHTESVMQAVRLLQEVMPVQMVLATLSEHGMLLTNGHVKHYEKAHRRQIADVSGAGDTVVSIAALASGSQTSGKAACTTGQPRRRSGLRTGRRGSYREGAAFCRSCQNRLPCRLICPYLHPTNSMTNFRRSFTPVAGR